MTPSMLEYFVLLIIGSRWLFAACLIVECLFVLKKRLLNRKYLILMIVRYIIFLVFIVFAFASIFYFLSLYAMIYFSQRIVHDLIFFVLFTLVFHLILTASLEWKKTIVNTAVETLLYVGSSALLAMISWTIITYIVFNGTSK